MNANGKVVARVRELSDKVIMPGAAGHDLAGDWPGPSIKALADAGLLGLTLPEELGGMDEGPSVFVAAVEELANACASTAMIFVMHVCATQAIKQSSLPQRDSVLSDIAAGKHLSTLAFSEKGSRSHFWAPVSQATEQNGLHILNCQKSFVTSAGHANSYVVSTRAVGATGMTESSLYYVEDGIPGFSVAGPWNGLGMRANASAPMSLENTRVSPNSLLSPSGEGFNVMMSVVLPWFQLGASAVANGIGRGALDAAAQHLGAAKLEHLNTTLASQPESRARLASARVALDASRALTAEAARSVENPDDSTMLRVLEVKACASETAIEVTDKAMRLCGGAGFSRKLPVERYFRDARAGSVMAPTTDALHDFIGKALLGLPLF
ncbi:MAG TPA: acyl-CoA dehydrogenase family protein [Blastocatellia bacterium]|nr:acyl-CoA dehydrogenase family protein [Blastocatellia bacterium]